jgi:hypothetical protein
MSKLENGILFSGDDMFVLHQGKRVAKRGRAGTPEAGRWIPLEPGYEVFDNDGSYSNRGCLLRGESAVSAMIKQSRVVFQIAVPLSRSP